MEEVIVLEVLDKSGQARGRVRLSSFPVNVGRAYDNDIILDDEYVSPHHLVIGKDAQGVLCATDLNSENGLYQTPSLKKVGTVPIAADNQLLLGNTHIRIRRTDFVVAPTRLSDRRLKSAQNMFNSWWLFLLLILAIAGMVLMERYLVSFQKVKYQELIEELISPLLVLLIWAGICAFIGRLMNRRVAYFAHANTVMLATLAFNGTSSFGGFYAFGFSTTSTDFIEVPAIMLIGCAMLYSHLHLATHLKRKTIAIASGLIVGGLLGIIWFSAHTDNAKLYTKLSYPVALQSPFFIAGHPVASDAYFSKAQTMKKLLDDARADDN